MKILLAMSGGIDSSVVAHLLKEQGHDVVGVRFTLWSDPLAPALAEILPTKCCSTQNIARADRVSKELKIPLRVINLEDEFKRTVVDPYLKGHAEGRTPNPCIGCNRNIKFGKLVELAQELGCEKLATGHYARTATEHMTDGTERSVLLEAVDQLKDQSYYLYGLTQEQLKMVYFPLGSMQKEQVYGLAEHFGVPLPDSYRESQDLCFFPEKTPKEFLKRHLQTLLQTGDIVRRDGTVVGTHEGIALYTIGQRRGLRIGGLKIPLEVVEKDTAHNRLIVAEQGKEKLESIPLSDVRFVSWKPNDNEAVPFECRVRSLSARLRGTLTVHGSTGIFHFEKPQSPQSNGQSLVLYRGEEVVGGGVMEG
jgi:tRNA-specific 2-thiouridylase